MRLFVLALSALMLAGCAGRPVATSEPSLEERYASFSARDENPSRSVPRAAIELAPILGEGAPTARLQVSEPADRGRRLRIVFDGQKTGTTGSMAFASSPDAEQLRALDPPPSEATVRIELARLFPTTTMRVLEKPRTNRFGPYGLAVGIDPAGQRCVYGWQWIEQEPSVRGAASVRIALCSKASRLDDLAGMLDGLHLDGIDTLPRMAAEKAARPPSTRRHAAAAPAGPPEARMRAVRVQTGDAPRPATDTRRTAIRSDAGMPLEPAFRSAPELDLPSQALRGPTAGLRTTPAAH